MANMPEEQKRRFSCEETRKLVRPYLVLLEEQLCKPKESTQVCRVTRADGGTDAGSVCKIYRDLKDSEVPGGVQELMDRFKKVAGCFLGSEADMEKHKLLPLYRMAHSATSRNYYLISKQASYGSVQDVARRRPLSEPELREVIISLVDALNYLWQNGVFQTCISPDHIFKHKDADGHTEYLLGGPEFCAIPEDVKASQKAAKYLSNNDDNSPYLAECDKLAPSEFDKAYPRILPLLCSELLQRAPDNFVVTLGCIDSWEISTELKSFLEHCISGNFKWGLKELMETGIYKRTPESLPELLCLPNCRYEFGGERLGDGGYSEVNKGVERSTGRTVAIKEEDLQGKDAKKIEQMEREANILRRIHERGIPNVAKLYDCFKCNGKIYLILEYVRGKTLEQFLKDRGSLSGDEIDIIAYKVSQILWEFKRANIFYRDLKGDNIIVTEDEHHKIVDLTLIDFNASRERDERNSMCSFVGTEGYMAPEVRTRHYSFPADVWSYGVLLFRIFKGKIPSRFYGEEKFNRLMGADQLVPGDVGETAGVYFEVMKGCLRQDPEKRIRIDHIMKQQWEGVVTKGIRRVEQSDYEIGEEVKGTEPNLYKCKHKNDGTNYLMKIYHGVPHEKCQRGIQALRYLRDCICFPKLKASYFLRNDLHVIYERYEARSTLRKLVQSNGMRKETLIAFANQLKQAIRDMHSHNIMHRGLNPDVLAVVDKVSKGEEKTAKLMITNFDFMKVCDPIHESGSVTVAESNSVYIAPEYRLKEPDVSVDKAADIWSYGAILYFMNYGEDPVVQERDFDFRSGDSRLRSEPVMPELNATIGDCLKWNPEERRPLA